MIELNKKTQQDFLNREWVQKLLDAGVDMSDAKYTINYDNKGHAFIDYIDKHYGYNSYPTYTVSELLYKLHEYIYPEIDGEKYSGGLKFTKDAPFYIWYYALKTKDYDPLLQQGKYNEDYIYAEAEYPIESLAMLLIQCHKKDVGIERKDTGDISGK